MTLPSSRRNRSLIAAQTSSDITGEYHHTVSYGALGYVPAQSFRLPAREEGLLFASAEETLRQLRATSEATPALARRAGVFAVCTRGSACWAV